MHIAILTFQGFNELDSLVALGLLNRVKAPGWRVTLCCPEPTVASMNGVTVHAQSTLAEARDADAVIVGSGVQTRAIVENRVVRTADYLNDASLKHTADLDALVQQHGADVIRYLLLSSHYRSPIEFSDQAIADAIYLHGGAWLRNAAAGAGAQSRACGELPIDCLV